MKIYFFYARYFSGKARQFYQDERGVYTVITGLMGFFLLGLIALTVDGSGILLDKARLSQGMEQASIALVTENNTLSKRKHAEITAFNPTKDEINKFGGSGSDEEKKFNTQRHLRDQELAKGIVSLYMRSYKAGYKPTEIVDDFDIKCKKQSLGGNNAVNTVSVCRVDGSINRDSWLPLSNNKGLTFQEKEKISSDRYYAVKRDSILIPLDVVLVNDFSGSMNERIAGASTKLAALKSVVEELGNLLIPGKNAKNVSPFNRIGYVNFSQGAPQNDGKPLCVLPYYGVDEIKEIEVPRQGFDMRKRGPFSGRDWIDFEILYKDVIPPNSFKKENCVTKRVWLESRTRPNLMCKLKANPTRVLAKAIEMVDVRTVDHLFSQYFDVTKSVEQIAKFDGKPKNYELSYDFMDAYCLGGGRHGTNSGKTLTDAWFTQTRNNIKAHVGNLVADGGTGASTGFLIGANILMGINPEPNAAPAKVGTNTQRVLLVLSDGIDNFPAHDTVPKLVNAGMCEAVKNKAEKLQDPNYDKLPLKLGFVAFGYDPRTSVDKFVKKYRFNGTVEPHRLTTDELKKEWYDAEGAVKQAEAWEKCVGKENYYLANSRDELMNAFKQILSTKDTVGRAMTNSPINNF